MSKPIKTHVFKGKRYNIKFLPPSRMPTAYGECDSPDSTDKTIKIDKSLHGLAELKVVVEEILHSLWFDTEEIAIQQAANDMATFLFRLGYRRIKKK